MASFPRLIFYRTTFGISCGSGVWQGYLPLVRRLRWWIDSIEYEFGLEVMWDLL